MAKVCHLSGAYQKRAKIYQKGDTSRLDTLIEKPFMTLDYYSKDGTLSKIAYLCHICSAYHKRCKI